MNSPIDIYSFDEAIQEIEKRIKRGGKTCIVHFLNVGKIVKATHDVELLDALWDGDFVLADGKPLLVFGSLLGVHLRTRVNGTDLMEKLLEISESEGFNVFLLGATQLALEKCIKNIIDKYPDIQIVGYRNGYFKSEEIDEIIETINKSKTDILFIGMSTPQKELFAFNYRAKLQVPVIQGVGGSFDVIAGLVKRAPKWMQTYGLEWLYRVIQEPKRMFWRYFLTNSLFLLLYVKFLYKYIFKIRFSTGEK